MDDLRPKFLEAGVNTVDMDERGERRVSLASYGYGLEAVSRALKAWGVVDSYLLNATITGRTPEPNNHGGPQYMLKFADGRWRFASFSGINGPPWTYCQAHGYSGNTGLEAELRRQVTMKQAEVDSLKNQYTVAQHDLTVLRRRMNQEIERGRTGAEPRQHQEGSVGDSAEPGTEAAATG